MNSPMPKTTLENNVHMPKTMFENNVPMPKTMLENNVPMPKTMFVDTVVFAPSNIHPVKKKRRYIRPAIDKLSVSSTRSLLSSSQGPWADAKPRNPDIVNNLWDDETIGGGESADGSVNWAGYQQDLSIW